MPYLQVFWHFRELGQIDTIVLNAKQLMDHCLRGNPDPDSPKHVSVQKFMKSQPISNCYCWISCNDKQSQKTTVHNNSKSFIGTKKILAFIALKRQSSEGKQVLALWEMQPILGRKQCIERLRTWSPHSQLTYGHLPDMSIDSITVSLDHRACQPPRAEVPPLFVESQTNLAPAHTLISAKKNPPHL